MARSLWIGALLIVVSVGGCRHASDQGAAHGGATEREDADRASAAAAEGDETATERPQVAVHIIRMEQKLEQDLALERDQVSVFVADRGRTTLRVIAQRRLHQLRLRLVSEGSTKEWAGELWSYEVRSADPGVPFEWVVWSSKRMEFLRLVSNPGPVSYAAWVEHDTLCFEEIRASRDAQVALAQHFSLPDGGGVLRVLAAQLVGAYDFMGVSTAALDIRAQSIERDAAGHWTVKVTGPRSSKVYTFVSPDGVNWERK